MNNEFDIKLTLPIFKINVQKLNVHIYFLGKKELGKNDIAICINILNKNCGYFRKCGFLLYGSILQLFSSLIRRIKNNGTRSS